MPINIPSGLYTGGRATFDTSPMTTQILKQDALEKARKAAEAKAAKAAIDKNYERMLTAVTPSGARTVDILDVKDAAGNVIAKGLQTQGQELLKRSAASGSIDPVELMNFKFALEQSKNLQREGEKMHERISSGKYLANKGDVDVIATQGRSMFDPEFKDYKETDLPALIPDLDENKWNEGLFGKTEPLQQEGKPTLAAGGNQYRTILKYSDEQKKNLADAAASQVRTSDSALKTFTEKMNNRAFTDRALPLFQSFYKTKELIDTPEKAAQASVLLEAEARKKINESSIYRPPAKPQMPQWQYELLYGTDEQNALNAWVQNAATQPPVPLKGAKGQALQIPQLNIGGVAYKGKIISVPKGVVDDFTIEKGKDWEKAPTAFFLTEDKQKVIPIYQKTTAEGRKQFTASGNPILDTEHPYSSPRDIQDFKTQLAPHVLKKKTSGEQIVAPVESTAPIKTGGKGVREVKKTKKTENLGF